MAFPHDTLADGEEVVEHLHPHWITLVPAVSWMLVICVGAGVGLAYLPDGSAHGIAVIAILVVAFLLLCWLTFSRFIVWRTTHYVFTTDRVLIRSGVLRHSGRDIGLARISDVGFVQTLWDRIVGAGTLTIESASENGQQRLVDVPHAPAVQQMLNRLIDADDERRHRRDPRYQ